MGSVSIQPPDTTAARSIGCARPVVFYQQQPACVRLAEIHPMSQALNDLTAALGTIIDPDLHQDLVSLNMIRDIVIEGQCREL